MPPFSWTSGPLQTAADRAQPTRGREASMGTLFAEPGTGQGGGGTPPFGPGGWRGCPSFIGCGV